MKSEKKKGKGTITEKITQSNIFKYLFNFNLATRNKILERREAILLFSNEHFSMMIIIR